MSQVITNAFEYYWQSSLAAEQPVVLDEFILADIPNLDITSPIDPDTGLPPESQIVHRQNVDQRGRINNNAVAYTIVMDTTVGDFSFNAMYLRNKQNGVIGMIVYKGRETKLKTDQTTGQTGNSLVKSMLMGYDQAAEATLTNVDAGTWQIDYAARLRGQDEDLRQLASQLYGHHTFIGDGFKVVQQAGIHQVTPGVAIVGGLRVELKQPEVIYPGAKPIGVWVDVHRAGSLLSEHQNHFTIITSVADLTDHVDGSGYQHYVAKLGNIALDGAASDNRVKVSSEYDFNYIFDFIKKLQSESGAGLVGGQPVYVTAEKYAGGASASSAFNDAAITAAIADAIATSNIVYWPAVYEVQGNIPNLHAVKHDGPGGIKRGTETFRVHPLEWHNNTLYCSPAGSDANDGLTADKPMGTIQRCMDLIGIWADSNSIQHGNWKFKILPGTFTEGGSYTGFVPVQNPVVFEGSSGGDSLPDVVIDGAASSLTAGMYFINGPSLIKVDSIASNNFRANSVASGFVFYGKGISEAYTYKCAAKNNLWAGVNADSICRYLLAGGTYDGNTNYNIRVRGGVAISGGVAGPSLRTVLKNNPTATQIRDCSSGHFDYVDFINHPSTPTGTAAWVANCSRVTFNACTLTNINVGFSSSEDSTIAIADDVTFTNVNTKFRLTNNGSIDQTPLYPMGEGLNYDSYRDEYTIGKYAYTGVAPASSSSAYALYTNRASSVIDYSILTNAPARQRLIFGYGTSAATRDKFMLDFNATGNREDHYLDGAVQLRIKAGSVSSGQNNVSSLGEGGVRFTTAYLETAPIISSDRELKTALLPITNAVLDACGDVRLGIFQWLDAIQQKGEDVARWHFGLIAQQVRDAFAAYGLDGTRYGLLCYDEWEDEFEPVIEEYQEEVVVVDRDGNEVTEMQTLTRETGEMQLVRAAGNRWGIRADQFLFLEAAYQRREVSRQKVINQQIMARLDILEAV
ncbi:phage tail protein [Aeromonas salmonicida]|uniref:phage tail-collar fiber domain-containing protein n=1 Tax=Aeromonas salmonicida TaxID=645 RepID=UPI0039A66D77